MDDAWDELIRRFVAPETPSPEHEEFAFCSTARRGFRRLCENGKKKTHSKNESGKLHKRERSGRWITQLSMVRSVPSVGVAEQLFIPRPLGEIKSFGFNSEITSGI